MHFSKFSVCSNLNENVLNIWGANGCNNDPLCKKGYYGDECNNCSKFFYPENGLFKEVDSRTGEGTTCLSEWYNKDRLVISGFKEPNLLFRILLQSKLGNRL